jgi:hypothetical protein
MLCENCRSSKCHFIVFGLIRLGLEPNKYFGFVTVVTSLTCLVLSHVMLKYASSTNGYCCFTKKDYFVTWNSNWEWCQWLMPHKEIDTMTISISHSSTSCPNALQINWCLVSPDKVPFSLNESSLSKTDESSYDDSLNADGDWLPISVYKYHNDVFEIQNDILIAFVKFW